MIQAAQSADASCEWPLNEGWRLFVCLAWRVCRQCRLSHPSLATWVVLSLRREMRTRALVMTRRRVA